MFFNLFKNIKLHICEFSPSIHEKLYLSFMLSFYQVVYNFMCLKAGNNSVDYSHTIQYLSKCKNC